MGEKVKGTVKWFSNRKGFGFITPSSDNSPTKEDIFVHQSNIITDAEYRTLKDGFEVSFEAVSDDAGKLKAQNVTSADGTPCPGPEPRERRNRNRKKKGGGSGNAAESGDDGEGAGGGGENGETNDNQNEETDENKEGGNSNNKGKRNRRRRNKNGKKPEGDGTGVAAAGGADGTAAAAAPKQKPAPKKPTWYSELDDNVKQSMGDRGVKIDGGRAFVTIGDARVKIGTTGYMAMAHKSGVIAEGTYTCEKDGTVKPTFNKFLKFDGGEWKSSDETEQKDIIVVAFKLTDESVKATGSDETPESLWGEDKSDPKDALESNGFQMRKVALHAVPGRRGRGRGRKFHGNKHHNNGKKQADGGESGGGETAPAATESTNA